jgi:hypothetical protein
MFLLRPARAFELTVHPGILFAARGKEQQLAIRFCY